MPANRQDHVVGDGERELDLARLIGAADLHWHGLDECSVGKPADAGPHRLLRACDDLVGDPPQIIEPVIAGDAHERLGPHPAGGHLGTDIAHDLLAEADVAREDGQQVLVRLACPVQAHQAG